MTMNSARRGLTLLEMVVAMTIFSTLLALVSQSLLAASQTSSSMTAKANVTEGSAATVKSLALELRYADSDPTYMSRIAVPCASDPRLQKVTWTFRVPTLIDDVSPYVHYNTDTSGGAKIGSNAGFGYRQVVYDESAGTVTEYQADDPTWFPTLDQVPLPPLATQHGVKQVIVRNVINRYWIDPAQGKSVVRTDWPLGGFYISDSAKAQQTPPVFDAYPPSGGTLALGLAVDQSTVSTEVANRSSVDGSVQDLNFQFSSSQSTVFLRSTLASTDSMGAIIQSGTTTGGTSTSGSTTGSPTLPPVITSPGTASGADGVAFSYQITATNSPTKYGLTGTLPTGLAIDTTAGIISGTPSISPSQLTFNVTISATNAAGTGTQALAMTFTPSSSNANAPTVTGGSVSATVGTAFSWTISATNMAKKDKPIGYGATNLPPGLGIDVSSGLISGTPTQAGTWSVVLSATNSSGTGYASLSISVNPAPLPPAPVVTGGSVGATLGGAFTYQISATNTSIACAPISYAAAGLPNGLSVNATSGVVSGTPTAIGSSAATISCTNAGGTGSATLTITVGPPATWNPVVTGASASGNVSLPFVYNISATNMDSSMYSGTNGYSCTGLPAGLGVNANSGAISGTPTAAGTYTVIATATNMYGSGSNTLTFTIGSAPPPTPVVTSDSVAATQGSAFSYTISATNMANAYGPVGYGATNLPAGLSINANTGKITGTPTVSGSFAVTITATNGGGTGSGTLSMTIGPQAVNNTPTVAGGSSSGAEGSSFSYQISATNMASKYHPVGYGASGLPSGLGVDSSSGVISGTPTAYGTYAVTISAGNSDGTGTATLTLTISPPAAPVVASATQTASTGVTYSYQISASNMGANVGAKPYVVSGLPTGLSYNSSNGLISGTPTQTGTFSIALTASNDGGTGNGTLTLTVSDPVGSISFTYNKKRKGNGDISGSYITVVPSSGWTVSSTSVNVSTSAISYSTAADPAAGTDVNFTGSVSSGAWATVTATIKSASGATMTSTSSQLTW